MTKYPTWMPVVAAAIFDGEGRVLMHRRPLEKHHGGLWEFPGGKVESGETPRIALVREIAEELGVTIELAALEPVAFAETSASGDDAAIVIFLYIARQWNGSPQSLEGGGWGWFTLEEAGKLDLPPLDCRLLDQLQKQTPF